MILKQKEIFPMLRFPDISQLKYGWCKIRSHQHKFESFPHYISKACLGKLILQAGDGMFTEYEYPDCQVVDVLQIKGKELIGYQIETGDFEEKEFHGTDTIIVSLKNAPEDIKECFTKLEKFFKQFVVGYE